MLTEEQALRLKVLAYELSMASLVIGKSQHADVFTLADKVTAGRKAKQAFANYLESVTERA